MIAEAEWPELEGRRVVELRVLASTDAERPDVACLGELERLDEGRGDDADPRTGVEDEHAGRATVDGGTDEQMAGLRPHDLERGGERGIERRGPSGRWFLVLVDRLLERLGERSGARDRQREKGRARDQGLRIPHE
jgi:hypothetical protein